MSTLSVALARSGRLMFLTDFKRFFVAPGFCCDFSGSFCLWTDARAYRIPVMLPFSKKDSIAAHRSEVNR
ncbi:hypothetical protein Q8A67_015655 [Cirrhinus molitorella]|uniref:Uncharacterized protein n=1 Tax=Cirrhinus molitorella TaxID=172907 RepID=A0AA88PI61_9TELE|nr:hypothetical protein Q8A67_015655 [Cirrhinus molitorella]